MSRAEQGKALAVGGLAFAGSAAGTTFSNAGMNMGAAIAIASGLCVAMFGLLYARWAEEAADKKRTEAYLNESAPCEGIKCQEHRWKHVRRRLWRMPESSLVYGGKSVCAECFAILLERPPQDGADKKAFG
jgi:hypothetical protein